MTPGKDPRCKCRSGRSAPAFMSSYDTEWPPGSPLPRTSRARIQFIMSPCGRFQNIHVSIGKGDVYLISHLLPMNLNVLSIDYKSLLLQRGSGQYQLSCHACFPRQTRHLEKVPLWHSYRSRVIHTFLLSWTNPLFSTLLMGGKWAGSSVHSDPNTTLPES